MDIIFNEKPMTEKNLQTIESAFVSCDISDGAILSFHHHLRDGDGVVNAVMAVADERGLKGLGLAMSSVFPVHAPLVDLMKRGVITRIWTDYAKGPVAQAISQGHLHRPRPRSWSRAATSKKSAR